jgi:hypothetical protein
MIASPGDVREYRSVVRDVILEWNYVNSMSARVVLMPVGWDTHSSPELGASAQELINDRVLEDCDLLIGIFWTRLGTPTASAASGTADEIRRHVEAAKPAMIYFSTAPASLETVDAQQYASLREFRDWCESAGLIETMDNALDFQTKVRRQLQITLHKSEYLRRLLSSALSDRDSTAATPEPAAHNPLAELAEHLTEEAHALLLEGAADRHGTILKVVSTGGTFVQTNGKTLSGFGDHRTSARWEFALSQLVATGLVLERGFKGEVFELSAPGYELADYLKART